MSKELINTQNPDAMKAAYSMLSYPHKYFANPANLPRLFKLVEGQKPAEKLIDLLSESQSKLASFLDFSPNDTEGFRRISDVLSDGAKAFVNVQSEIDSSLPPEMLAELQKSYIQTVNTNIAEHINGQKIKLVDGELDSDAVSSILDVAWVVQHFALLISGTLTLEICEDGSLMFKQREPDLLPHGLAVQWKRCPSRQRCMQSQALRNRRIKMTTLIKKRQESCMREYCQLSHNTGG